MAARSHHTPWFAWLALLAGLTIPVASAAAQTPARPDQPQASGPGQNGAVTEEGKSGAPLSQQLSKSDGVLHPAEPAVDPGMAQAPPSTGPNSMPVITPNEAPAPDTKVSPK
jgi:hypothetical protein